MRYGFIYFTITGSILDAIPSNNVLVRGKKE
jgi:hypothetical protein